MLDEVVFVGVVCFDVRYYLFYSMELVELRKDEVVIFVFDFVWFE